MKLTLIAFDDTIKDGSIAVDHFTRNNAVQVEVIDNGFKHPKNVVDEAARILLAALEDGKDQLAIFCRDGGIPNFVGHMIGEKIVCPEAVVILLYSRNGCTEHKYDKDGYLAAGWPYGVLDWDVTSALNIVRKLHDE